MRSLREATRLPMALLIEDAIDALWETYVEEGFDLGGPNGSRR